MQSFSRSSSVFLILQRSEEFRPNLKEIVGFLLHYSLAQVGGREAMIASAFFSNIQNGLCLNFTLRSTSGFQYSSWSIDVCWASQ